VCVCVCVCVCVLRVYLLHLLQYNAMQLREAA
jgi:hypothetical protein